jgi:hypothetical protein
MLTPSIRLISTSGNRQPFSIRFLSDAFDLTAEATAAIATPKGFKLCYVQDANSC